VGAQKSVRKPRNGGFVDGSHEWGWEGSGDCGRVVIENRGKQCTKIKPARRSAHSTVALCLIHSSSCMSLSPNGISTSSAVFAGLVNVILFYFCQMCVDGMRL